MKTLFNRKFGKKSQYSMFTNVIKAIDLNSSKEERDEDYDIAEWIGYNVGASYNYGKLTKLNVAPYLLLSFTPNELLEDMRVVLERMDTPTYNPSPKEQDIDNHNNNTPSTEETVSQEQLTEIDNEKKTIDMDNQQSTSVVKVKGEDGKYYFLKADGSKFTYTFVANAPIIIVHYNYDKRLLTFKSGINRDNNYAPVSELVHQWFRTHGYNGNAILSGAPKSINEVMVFDNVFNVQLSQSGKYYVRMIWENNDPSKGLVEPSKFKNFIRFNKI